MPTHPGLHVFYTNRVERLAAQLTLDISRFRGDDHGWTPTTIVVPNPNVKDYLKRGLADALGVAANLRFHFLEGFWRTYLGQDPKAQLLDRTALRGVILSLLQDEDLLSRPELTPIRAYLTGAPQDLKRVQLAERLAGCYERYLLHRPDWLQAWERGKATPGARPEELAAWQRALWREIRKALSGSPWLTLPEWLENRSFDRATFPDTVFIFGMSHMAPLYHHALARLGERTAVRLYLMNPCKEPWDSEERNASGLRRVARAANSNRDDLDDSPEDPFNLLVNESSPFLHRWARPGREQLRLLIEVTQGDFVGSFDPVDPSDAPGTLAVLQSRIIEPSAPSETSDQNDSLRVIPCPTPAREAEVVASLIWEMVRKPGSTLHFDDICVLVPPAQQDRYALHLRDAFAGAEGIPWAHAMGASRRLRDFAEAGSLLLRTATGDLSRAELLRMASHPILAARWQGLDPDAWPGLCERAGIVARLDAAETEGTYLAGGVWTWDQGLTRMALGCFMKEEAVSSFLPVAGAEAPGLVASLGALAADLRALSAGRLTVSSWLGRLERILQAYLLPDPASAEEGEADAFIRLLKGLERLRGLESAYLPAPVMDFQAFRSLAAGALESLLADQALPPGRGVQVGCYTPLRAIPFKALFLLGLGEGLFPAADRSDPMDLLAESPRRAGDVSVSEKDRYLFLEALLSARESLVITYPSRDALTGEELQPSPLLLDLAEALGPEVWSQVLLKEQPRHRHDPRAFAHLNDGACAEVLPSHLREARAEAELHYLGLRLREQIGNRDLPLALLERQASEGTFRELRPRLRSVTPLTQQPPTLPERIRVSLAQLQRWLECPVQGGESLRLGIRNADEEDPADLSQEPLDTTGLERYGLLHETFWSWIVDPAEALEGAYQSARSAREATARVPRGPMAEGEQGAHLSILATWKQQLPEHTSAIVHRFGSGLPTTTSPLPVEDHPPLDLDLEISGKSHTVRLEGVSDPVSGVEFLLLTNGKMTGLTRKGQSPSPALTDQRRALGAWIAHLALCAQGDGSERQARLMSANVGTPAVLVSILPALTPQEARDQLAAWLGEIFSEQPSRRLMPIEALLKKPEVVDLREFIDGSDDSDDRPSLVCFRGPIPRVKDLEVEPDLEVGRRRLAKFLDIASNWRAL